jgi:hypothetical protein
MGVSSVILSHFSSTAVGLRGANCSHFLVLQDAVFINLYVETFFYIKLAVLSDCAAAAAACFASLPVTIAQGI